MCGIGGFFNSANKQPVSTIKNMLKPLIVRGPDAQAWVGWDQNWQQTTQLSQHALLHTRLAIRDLSSSANQPMSNKQQSVWICYNGEVYDWEKDAEYLKQQGYIFNTHSDTEFILHAYEHWGLTELIPRLRGMFALCILDLKQQRVWLLRDRMGLKPLTYYHGEYGFAFSSINRALLPWLPSEAKTFNPSAIDAYLAHRYIPAPLTLLNQLNRLENSHYLEYDLTHHQLKKHYYWQPEKKSTLPLNKTLSTSIALRTIADCPVGLFLSGGVDSSVLAYHLSDMGYKNITTFTASFSNSSLDESHRAKLLAKSLNLPFHAVTMPDSIKNDFEQIIADLDEPFADPSALPSWYLAQYASQFVKVAINGDGGDELFGGYKRYYQHLRTNWRRIALPLPLKASAQHKGWHKILNELSVSWHDAYTLRFSGFTPSQRLFLQPHLEAIPTHYWRLPSVLAFNINSLLDIDQMNYLPDYVLRKSDLVSMAHGLEGRSPLLDHHLVNSIHSLETRERFTTPSKAALVNLCRLPDALNPLLQKKKGFNPPLEFWLRNSLSDYHQELGSALQYLTNGQIAATAVNQLLSRYLNGAQNYAEQILQLIILRVSLQQYKDL